MRTVHCPLCGLRFARASELDAHAQDAHAPAVTERHDTLTVVRTHHVERPVDRVLRRG